MKNLDGKTTPVGTLLSQDYFFRVPEYQRPFSWEGDNFEDLIDDIVSANKTQEYFLGTIVLHQTSKGNYDVVDGQQRLTSLLVLLACLRDKVKNKKYKEGIQAKILQTENVVDGIPEKVRLEVKDRKIFADIVVKEGGTAIEYNEKDFPEPEWRYVQAVRIFNKRLSQLTDNDAQQIITFVNQKCIVIYLATSTFDDAFRLFTIVNDRGKQLRRIDVLKSINIAPDIVTKDTVRNRIAQKWEELEKELGESAFEGVFHLIRMILLKDKPQGDLLSEFQDRILAKGTVQKGEPFVDLVFDYATLYRKVFDEKLGVPASAPEHNKYRALIHIMDSEFMASEWRACLLFFAHKFSGEQLYEFCLKIEKLYLEHWFSAVRKDERYASYAKILGTIEKAKKTKDVLSTISYDEDRILAGLMSKNLYGTGYCKYVLLRLELLASEHDVPKEFTAKSIEHVLPQNPENKGYWADNHNLKEISAYVNMIGNLVLLSKGKNSAAQNFDFDRKKELYLKGRISDYPRSLQVLEHKKWDKATILKRNDEAKKLFLKDP